MDVVYRPVYNRLMRVQPSWDESIALIMGWDWDYIAPCHGEPVASDAKQVLRKHLNI